MLVSTILIAYVGTVITERSIVPKLGKYSFEEEEVEEIKKEPTSKELKGLIISIIAVVAILIPIIYCIIPGLPFSGLLLYLRDSKYVDQLFGNNSYLH